MTDTAPTVQTETSAAPSDAALVNPSEPTTPDTEQATAQPEVNEGVEAKKDPEREAQKKLTRSERRIGELTYKVREAERRNAELAERLAQLETKGAQQQNAKPSRENFQSEDDFVEALTDWKLEQKLNQVEQKRTQDEGKKQTQVRQEAVRQAFEAKEAEFAAKTPDYHDTMEDFATQVPRDPNSALITNVLLSHEKAPELLYAIAKNPDLAGDLYAKHHSFAAAKLNQIAASLGQSKAPQKVTLSDPIKSPQGSAVIRSESQMSGKELRKKYKV